MEFRTEVPRLSQQSTSLQGDLEKVVERLESAEQSLAAEIQGRRQSEMSLSKNVREHATSETQRIGLQLSQLQKFLDEVRVRTDTTHSDVRTARECVEKLAVESNDMRLSLDACRGQMDAFKNQVVAVQSQVSQPSPSEGFEKKFIEIQ